MSKSIHERVRAALAKQERERERNSPARAAALAASRQASGRMLADLNRERRIDRLIDGTADPRNAEERAIVDRAHFGAWEDEV